MARKPMAKGAGKGEAKAADELVKKEPPPADVEDNSTNDEASEDEDDQCCRPDVVERHCTDVGWLFPFIIGLAAASWVVDYAIKNGELENFRAFQDLEGKYCSEFPSTKYLYFCMNHPGKLNISNPVCVPDCPNDTVINHSFACESYGIFKNTTDYPTEPYFGMVCKPMQQKLRMQISYFLIQSRHATVKRLVLDSPESITATILLAVMVSYLYLSFLGRCAHFIVWTGLIIAIMVPMTFGFYFMSWLTWIGFVPRPNFIFGHVDANPILGGALIFVGMSFACCGMRMSGSVDKAMQVLEDAIDCVMDVRTLQWLPAIHLVLNIITNIGTFTGIVFLLSCQDINLAFTRDKGPLVHLFLLSTQECIYLAVLIFMFVWIQQANLVTSTFVTTYLAQIWSYNGGLDGEAYVPHWVLCQAYWACYRYHFGTVLKGSLVIALTRPIRLVMGVVVGFTEMKANAIGACIGACCCLCIDFFDRWFVHLNQAAFIEVVLNARPFCPAARAQLRVTDFEADTKRLLHGASRVFQLAGITLIGAVGAVAMCVMRAAYDDFDLQSDRQVAFAKVTFLILGLIIAIAVCFPFMMLFNTVADTILYIRTVEMLRSVRERERNQLSNMLASCACCTRVRPDLPDIRGYIYGDVPEYEALQPQQAGSGRGRGSRVR